jgi:two-component system cell cycle sensor histidine kinase/response regulator CckA
LCICEDHAGPIHSMLTDVIMPGMSGRQLAEQVAFGRPQMKVLFVSGSPDNAMVHHEILHAGIFFIQRLFSPENLAKKVREILIED